MRMVRNIYDYLKYKWEHSDKEDLAINAIIVWALSACVGIVLGVIWGLLGVIFFVVWGMVTIIAFSYAVWYVCKEYAERVGKDYRHYVSEFGKHKNEDIPLDEQMQALDELFDAAEEELVSHLQKHIPPPPPPPSPPSRPCRDVTRRA